MDDDRRHHALDPLARNMSKTTFSWGSVVTCAGLLLTGAGLTMTAHSIQQNTKAQRAGFLFQIYQSYPQSSAAVELHHRIDARDFEEWREEWRHTEKDTALTSLLWYYDLVAYLLDKEILKRGEDEPFLHDRETFAASKGVKQYLEALKKTDQKNGVSAARYPFFERWIEAGSRGPATGKAER